MYDVYVPLVKNVEMSLPFDEAYEMVVKGLAPLGKDYQALLRKAKDERWIDRHIPDGASVCINIGTTTEAVAYALLEKKNLRVLTNNLNVARICAGQSPPVSRP